MGIVFINVYNFFIKHTKVLVCFIILLVCFEAYSIYNAKFSDDITEFFPKDKSLSGLSDFMHNSKFADQIIIDFTLRDTNKVEPDSLIKIASTFYDSLSQDTVNIANIKFKIDDKSKLQAYQFFYDNLPLFLDSNDYKNIRDKLSSKNIDNTLSKNLQALMSISGIVSKRFILEDPLSLTPLVIGRLKNFNVDNNYLIYKSCIFSKDKKYLLLFIEPKSTASNIKKDAILLDNIDVIKERLIKEYPEISIGSYGGPVVTLLNSRRVKKDVMLTVTLALLILITLFLLVFRKLRIFNLLFFPIVLGAGLAISILSYVEGSISTLVLGVGAVLIGISIDYSLHFFTHYRNSKDIKLTFKSVSEPIIVSCLTTSLTFLCLYTIKSEVLTQLGLFVALSVFFTALFVLTIIPQFLRFIHLDDTKVKKITILDRASKFDMSKKNILVYIVLLLSVVFMISSKNLSFNGDISSLNYLTKDVRQLENTLKKISPDVSSIVSIMAQGNTLDEALQNSERINPIVNKLKKDGKIRSYITVNDIMMSKQMQNKKLNEWNGFWKTINIDSLHQNFVSIGKKYYFKEKTFTDFFNKLKAHNKDPDYSYMRKLLLDNYISKSKDGNYHVISIVKMDSKNKAELFEELKGMKGIYIFDQLYYTNMFLNILKQKFNLLVIISMILVFIILWISLGRIELAIITYLPIAISWIWTIGMMGLFGIEFNIFSIIITTFIFGLGIDYSIFLMRALLNNYKYGNVDISPYRLSVILSVCTTIGGIGVLIFAQHPALKSIATVSIFGILSVIFVTFTLLPRFFSWLIVGGGKKRISPIVMVDIFISLGSFLVFFIATILLTLLIPLYIILPIPIVKKKRKFSFLLYLFCNSIVKINFTIKRKYIDKSNFDLSEPKIIVSNHQSHLDLVLLLMLNPKIVVLTNKWVWNNLFYGFIIRYAGFYSIANGVENGIDKLKEKVKDGYSILVFPEGTRSKNGNINRFHQGAFKLAHDLNISILPVLINGAYECLPKTEFFLHSGNITLKFYKPIKVLYKDFNKNESYRNEAQQLTKYYREELAYYRNQGFNTHYYRKVLISKYIYKGPILEWYLRFKISMENDYEIFESLLPKVGKIIDIGCGYGFLCNILKLTGGSRSILGIDYDEEKIRVAQNIAQYHADYLNLKGLSFEVQNIISSKLPQSNAFILSDVLHYMPLTMQRLVLQKCMDALSPKGVIIVRDANSDYKKRTKRTKLTEFFSTKVFAFNKTDFKLEFTSAKNIQELAKRNGMYVKIMDVTKYTSNIISIIKREND